ncbi:hemerythrin domain-containing protein [Actinospica acidithermotolerans]|nr:hemerythrin domain-containing protein [Actinospica acidithermotolerans]
MLEPDDAAKEIAREHDEIDRLILRISMLGARAGDGAVPGAPDERAAYVHSACVRFAYHVHAEEKHLHQAMRRHLPDGGYVVEKQRLRDRAVLRTIECCELPDIPADERDVLIGQLVVGVQDHVERYDAELLPGLIRACPLAESRRVAVVLHAGVQAVRDKWKIANGSGPERDPAEDEPAPARPRRGLRGLLHRRTPQPEQPSADHKGYAT